MGVRLLVVRQNIFHVVLVWWRNPALPHYSQATWFMSELNYIHYPSKESEFEVQATLWAILRDRGIHVRGGVPARCRDEVLRKDPRCYLDLVVFSTMRTPILIIEVKNRDKSTDPGLRGRQKRRYEQFNLPVLVCERSTDIQRVASEAEKILILCEGGVDPVKLFQAPIRGPINLQ